MPVLSFFAAPTGIEPVTPGLENRCSIRLSYEAVLPLQHGKNTKSGRKKRNELIGRTTDVLMQFTDGFLLGKNGFKNHIHNTDQSHNITILHYR